MPTFADNTEAIRVFQSHIQARLNADYAATFEPFGGAMVILEDEQPDEDDRDKKPYLVLSVGADSLSSDSSSNGDMRDAVIEGECVANDWSGAVTDAENPTGSDTLLSRAFIEIVRADYAVLRDLGFYRNRLESSREIINAADGEQYHRNPHRFSFSYFAS